MILGLAGPAGAGKDTVADILCDIYGFKKIRFADPLRRMLEAAGIYEPEANRKNDPLDGLGFSWRKAAQLLGTEWGRELNPNIWVMIAKNKTATEPDTNWVFSDTRFGNEELWVRSVGHLIHVRGRSYDLRSTDSVQHHASELGLPVRADDLIINNDRELIDLKHRVTVMMGEHFGC